MKLTKIAHLHTQEAPLVGLGEVQMCRSHKVESMKEPRPTIFIFVSPDLCGLTAIEYHSRFVFTHEYNS